MDNGNYCECCVQLGDVELYLDSDDEPVDLCTKCYEMLTGLAEDLS